MTDNVPTVDVRSEEQTSHVVPVNRSGNIRDALLWGSAFLPLIALALVPRRRQLSTLRREIATLTEQSHKQQETIRENLAQFRNAQEAMLRSSTKVVDKLLKIDQQVSDNRDGLVELRNIIELGIREREASQTSFNSTVLGTFEEVQSNLASLARSNALVSKRIGSSLADIAAWIERREVEHGEDVENPVEQLRHLALELERSARIEPNKSSEAANKPSGPINQWP